jgi:DNA-binding NarL/FixJ family response regulator
MERNVARSDEVTKLVVVEDDKGIRDNLVRLLSSEKDFRCLATFGTGEEALSNIPRLQPDVVLVDINLPGMSGIELVSALKQRDPSTQCLMLTVYENSKKVFQALSAGACGYMLKRAPSAKLLAAIREVRNGGSPMSGTVARLVVQSFHRPGAPGQEEKKLSPREEEILDLLAAGLLYKEIAAKLDIGQETVRTHIRHIYEKLHVHTRTEAVVKYLRG